MIALDSSAVTCKLKQVGNPEKRATETKETYYMTKETYYITKET